MTLILEVARAEGLSYVEGSIQSASEDMQTICKNLGFTLTPTDHSAFVKAHMELK
jgi:hypothetical protein